MYQFKAFLKLLIFAICFTIIFWGINQSNLLPQTVLEKDRSSLIPIFSGISLIFSILSGFIIQFQWQKWEKLIDASRGEVNMLRHIFIMSSNYSGTTGKQIQKNIYSYLKILLESSLNDYSGKRSKSVDKAIQTLDESIFSILDQHSSTGMGLFMLFSRAVEYRELRIQNGLYHLPKVIKFFIVVVLMVLICLSMCISFDSLILKYILTLTLSLLVFGIYLLIDDLDYPLRPGTWQLRYKGYKELYKEVKKELDLKK